LISELTPRAVLTKLCEDFLECGLSQAAISPSHSKELSSSCPQCSCLRPHSIFLSSLWAAATIRTQQSVGTARRAVGGVAAQESLVIVHRVSFFASSRRVRKADKEKTNRSRPRNRHWGIEDEKTHSSSQAFAQFASKNPCLSVLLSRKVLPSCANFSDRLLLKNKGLAPLASLSLLRFFVAFFFGCGVSRAAPLLIRVHPCSSVVEPFGCGFAALRVSVVKEYLRASWRRSLV